MTYEEAIKYLTETNNLHLIQKELSTDGYTVVALAEYLKTLDNQSHL
jgi:tmRNA-binding protein